MRVRAPVRGRVRGQGVAHEMRWDGITMVKPDSGGVASKTGRSLLCASLAVTMMLPVTAQAETAGAPEAAIVDIEQEAPVTEGDGGVPVVPDAPVADDEPVLDDEPASDDESLVDEEAVEEAAITAPSEEANPDEGVALLAADDQFSSQIEELERSLAVLEHGNDGIPWSSPGSLYIDPYNASERLSALSSVASAVGNLESIGCPAERYEHLLSVTSVTQRVDGSSSSASVLDHITDLGRAFPNCTSLDYDASMSYGSTVASYVYVSGINDHLESLRMSFGPSGSYGTPGTDVSLAGLSAANLHDVQLDFNSYDSGLRSSSYWNWSASSLGYRLPGLQSLTIGAVIGDSYAIDNDRIQWESLKGGWASSGVAFTVRDYRTSYNSYPGPSYSSTISLADGGSSVEGVSIAGGLTSTCYSDMYASDATWTLSAHPWSGESWEDPVANIDANVGNEVVWGKAMKVRCDKSGHEYCYGGAGMSSHEFHGAVRVQLPRALEEGESVIAYSGRLGILHNVSLDGDVACVTYSDQASYSNPDEDSLGVAILGAGYDASKWHVRSEIFGGTVVDHSVLGPEDFPNSWYMSVKANTYWFSDQSYNEAWKEMVEANGWTHVTNYGVEVRGSDYDEVDPAEFEGVTATLPILLDEGKEVTLLQRVYNSETYDYDYVEFTDWTATDVGIVVDVLPGQNYWTVATDGTEGLRRPFTGFDWNANVAGGAPIDFEESCWQEWPWESYSVFATVSERIPESGLVLPEGWDAHEALGVGTDADVDLYDVYLNPPSGPDGTALEMGTVGVHLPISLSEGETVAAKVWDAQSDAWVDVEAKSCEHGVRLGIEGVPSGVLAVTIVSGEAELPVWVSQHGFEGTDEPEAPEAPVEPSGPDVPGGDEPAVPIPPSIGVTQPSTTTPPSAAGVVGGLSASQNRLQFGGGRDLAQTASALADPFGIEALAEAAEAAGDADDAAVVEAIADNPVPDASYEDVFGEKEVTEGFLFWLPALLLVAAAGAVGGFGAWFLAKRRGDEDEEEEEEGGAE